MRKFSCLVITLLCLLVCMPNLSYAEETFGDSTDQVLTGSLTLTVSDGETYTVISSTTISGGGFQSFTLPKSVNITGFSISIFASGPVNIDVYLYFYDSSNNLIYSKRITNTGTRSIDVSLYDVKKIAVRNESRVSQGIGYTAITIRDFILTLAPKLPSQVVNVNVKDITVSSALITWDPNPEEVQKYIIYLNGQIYGETTDTEYMIDNLLSDTSYEVTVTAVNDLGEGPASEPCIFTTPELPPEPASQVKNLVIKNMTSTSAVISWTPNPEAERITKYVIYINGKKYGETENTEYFIEGLKEGEKYVVTVTAVNDLGEGPASEPVTFTTSKIADISTTIKVQDILSSIAVLFTTLWPLLAFALALIAVVPITTVLKQTVRRRSDA